MYQNELYHHGVKGQKWGIRRFQNKDGTLIKKGKKFVKNHKKLLITGAAVVGSVLATIGGMRIADAFLNSQNTQAVNGLMNQMLDVQLIENNTQQQMIQEQILQDQLMQQQMQQHMINTSLMM